MNPPIKGKMRNLVFVLLGLSVCVKLLCLYQKYCVFTEVKTYPFSISLLTGSINILKLWA